MNVAGLSSALKGSVLVVAHPDDEILWFGSVAPHVRKIVICFLHDPAKPELSTARSRVLADHPLADRIECLELTETNAFGRAMWPNPEPTDFGVKIRGSRDIARTYKECAGRLRAALTPILDKADNIFTHNPWGEYGHEEHLMVHRVVTSLAQRNNTPVWYNNYVSNWSQQLAHRYVFDPRDASFGVDVDTLFMQDIAELYRKHDAWTWFDDYQWFANERMLGGADALPTEPRFGRTLPLNFIRLPERRNKSVQPGGKITRKARRIWGRVTGKEEQDV